MCTLQLSYSGCVGCVRCTSCPTCQWRAHFCCQPACLHWTDRPQLRWTGRGSRLTTTPSLKAGSDRSTSPAFRSASYSTCSSWTARSRSAAVTSAAQSPSSSGHTSGRGLSAPGPGARPRALAARRSSARERVSAPPAVRCWSSSAKLSGGLWAARSAADAGCTRLPPPRPRPFFLPWAAAGLEAAQPITGCRRCRRACAGVVLCWRHHVSARLAC
jgi:hypothetical protein